MEVIINLIKVLILSIVEGVTEFLPVSSTGHLILFNEFVKLSPENFANAFNIIIQLGAILSVVVIYFNRLNPFAKNKVQLPERYPKMNPQSKLYYRIKGADQKTLDVWKKIIVGVIPAGVLGLLFDDYIDEHFMNPYTVATTLLVYGIIILWMEDRNKNKKNYKFNTVADIDYKTAFQIGLFQCLALIPGTSRSAATIIGAMVLGTSRIAAADFSFFLAIPTMVGATLLKIIKNLGGFTAMQWFYILVGFILSFLVAYWVIKKFLSYIKNNDFKVFGYYRIVLSIIVFLYFIIKHFMA